MRKQTGGVRRYVSGIGRGGWRACYGERGRKKEEEKRSLRAFIWIKGLGRNVLGMDHLDEAKAIDSRKAWRRATAYEDGCLVRLVLVSLAQQLPG